MSKSLEDESNYYSNFSNPDVLSSATDTDIKARLEEVDKDFTEGKT